MAKIKKPKATKSSFDRSTKDCYVKLTRQNLVTHNISAKVQRNKMEIGGKTIVSKDNVFDIDVKISNAGISITQSKIGTDRAVGSLPPRRILRSQFQATGLTDQNIDLQPHRNLTVAKTCFKPKLVEKAWQQCKANRENYSVRINDFVMAKLRGHLAWPAKIIEILNEKKQVKVQFYGVASHEMFGFIYITEIVPFKDAADVISLTLEKNNAKFMKGVKEAEIHCGIPLSASLLNQLVDE